MTTITTFIDSFRARGARTRFSWFTMSMIALIIGVFVQNLILLRQNQELRGRFSQGANREIKPGEEFSRLSGVNLQKNYVEWDFSASKKGTLLISFSPGCGVCHDNLKNWITLTSH